MLKARGQSPGEPHSPHVAEKQGVYCVSPTHVLLEKGAADTLRFSCSTLAAWSVMQTLVGWRKETTLEPQEEKQLWAREDRPSDPREESRSPPDEVVMRAPVRSDQCR